MIDRNINIDGRVKSDIALKRSIAFLSSLASVAENLVKSMHINPTAFDSVFFHKGPMFREIDVHESIDHYSFMLHQLEDDIDYAKQLYASGCEVDVQFNERRIEFWLSVWREAYMAQEEYIRDRQERKKAYN